MTSDEMALVGLASGDSLPNGGFARDATVRSGHGSAKNWLEIFGAQLSERFRIDMYAGSLNLWFTEPIELPNPWVISEDGIQAGFCPLILDEKAIGLAFRTQDGNPLFLEVFSPVKLRDRLSLDDGTGVRVRILSGEILAQGV